MLKHFCLNIKLILFLYRDTKLLHLYIFYKKQNFRNKVIAIQIDHLLDATVSPVFYLTFIYGSTCFGRSHAHHQDLNNCRRSLWFHLRSVVKAVLLVVVMGVRTPETCWAVNKRQVKYWKICCVWLVIYLKCMLMHGLANFKFKCSIIVPVAYRVVDIVVKKGK
jgi:hypothetical protein